MSGFEEMLSDEERTRLEKALDDADAYHHAKKRLLRTLADPPRINPDNHRWWWLMAPWIDSRFRAEINLRFPGYWETSRFWRRERAQGRDCDRDVPAWVYWPMVAWEYRYRLIFRPLILMGFWLLPEGGMYVEGRWSWRFWRSKRVILGTQGPWQRLSYFLLRVEARYAATRPPTFSDYDDANRSAAIADELVRAAGKNVRGFMEMVSKTLYDSIYPAWQVAIAEGSGTVLTQEILRTTIQRIKDSPYPYYPPPL